MLNNLPFQAFAWTASVLFAGEALLAKYISKHSIKNPWLFNFLWVFFVFVLNTAVCLWVGISFPEKWGDIILAGVFFALAMGLFMFANNYLDITVLTPLFNIRTIFAVILGVVFLGEVITIKQYWLIGLMVVSGVIISLDERMAVKSFLSKGFGFAMAEMATLALMALFLNRALAHTDFWTVNFWYNLIGFVLVIFSWPFAKEGVKILTKPQVAGVFLMAFLGVFGNLAVLKAYKSNISISGAILSLPLSMVVVIVLSIFFPKLLEHHTWKVYTIRILAAIILVYAGIKII